MMQLLAPLALASTCRLLVLLALQESHAARPEWHSFQEMAKSSLGRRAGEGPIAEAGTLAEAAGALQQRPLDIIVIRDLIDESVSSSLAWVLSLPVFGKLLLIGVCVCVILPMLSPRTHRASKLHRGTDREVGYQYIELPPDMLFVEGVAHNDDWEVGVGYVPLLRLVNGVKETHLYEIRPGMAEAKHLGGPVRLTTADTLDVTVYGCHLTSVGLLYLCFWNKNCVSWIDLKDLPADRGELRTSCVEIPAVAPNDVCVDPEDEDILYVAGGGCVGCAANAAKGTIYRAVVSKDHTSCDGFTIVAEGLNVLAGIEVSGRYVLVAQLYNAIAIDKHDFRQRVVWDHECHRGVWLADNVAMFDDKMVIAPAFTTVPRKVADYVMKNFWLNTIGVLCLNMYSAFEDRESLNQGLWDPEVSLALSQTYATEESVPQPVRIAIFDTVGKDIHNFEIDLVETQQAGLHDIRDIEHPPHEVLGRRWKFDEQVTACVRWQMPGGSGFLVCVNFQQPRILLLNDKFFKDAIGGSGGPTVV